jgi:hypothetical protein
MSVKDIIIPLFHSNLLVSSNIAQEDRDKIKKTIEYHDFVRQCWINYKKSNISEEYRSVNIQYEAVLSHLNSICLKFSPEIKTLSFQLLNDVVNWFHSNKIQFTVHDCHEYEIIFMTDHQFESLNTFIGSKYGSNVKFILLY